MSKIIRKTGYHLLMIALAAAFIFPFYIMVITAFKTDQECYLYPVTLLPNSFFNIEAYKVAFHTMPFFQYLKNTGIIALSKMLGVFLTTPLAAYSLARLRWRMRGVVFMATLAMMMIPYQVTMVPTYMIFTKLGLVGTYLPLIIPSFVGVPFYVFLLRQFFRGMPKDLEDAARIDGASELAIFYKVFMPLCKPAIVTILVLELLGSWNDFTGPLIYLTRGSMYTLQIGLSQFKNMTTVQVAPIMAASTLICLPILILFFFAQRQFMEGITFSGIKG